MNTNPNAKRILCYGDSHTYWWMSWYWRYPSDIRFTGVLQNILGEGFEIIEEWLRWRMISGENAFFPYRNWREQFDGILWSHLPLDIIVLFLWTNDMNSWCEKSYDDMLLAFRSYQEAIVHWADFFQCAIPKVLLVCPPIVKEEFLPAVFAQLFSWSTKKAEQLPGRYSHIADLIWWAYVDSNSCVTVSKMDGIHIDEKGHKMLAKHLAEIVVTIL